MGRGSTTQSVHNEEKKKEREKVKMYLWVEVIFEFLSSKMEM